MSNAKYFAILMTALAAGLWLNILHHTQISREWHNAGIKFAQVEAQIQHLEVLCLKGK
jgi:hypothetical protein